MKIIHNQLVFKLGQCTHEELDVIQTKNKIRKAAGFDKTPPEDKEFQGPTAPILQPRI